MPSYIRFEDVRLRLLGKVRFTNDPQEENEMTEELANRLICEGESKVELDLSPRYHTPFMGANGCSFSKLPNSTRNLIRSLCEMQGVMKILDIDFGRGTIVNASNYYDRLEKRYNETVGQLIAYRDGYGSGRKTPPLDGLRLAYHNAAADDGFVGMVLITGEHDQSGAYPAARINDPSLSFWTGSARGEDYDDES